jgi:predicted kinase
MAVVVMICGLPGVGKTTTARILAPLIHGVVISSDEIRKNLFKKPTYKWYEKELVYKILLLLAKYLYSANVNCIIDATFSKEKTRQQVRTSLGLDAKHFYIIECVCPEHIVMARLKGRKGEFSDANYSVYSMMKRIYEPVKGEHTKLDTRSIYDNEIRDLASRILERR